MWQKTPFCETSSIKLKQSEDSYEFYAPHCPDWSNFVSINAKLVVTINTVITTEQSPSWKRTGFLLLSAQHHTASAGQDRTAQDWPEAPADNSTSRTRERSTEPQQAQTFKRRTRSNARRLDSSPTAGQVRTWQRQRQRQKRTQSLANGYRRTLTRPVKNGDFYLGTHPILQFVFLFISYSFFQKKYT